MAEDSPKELSGIGWNWLWFGPAILFVLIATERHTIPYAWMIVKLYIKRWHWIGVISPSAGLCFAVLITSVTVPFIGVLQACEWLADRSQSKRVIRVMILLIFILILPFITDTLVWGSFPFTYDDAGYGHIRFIPFIPWPSGGYGAL